MVPRKSGGKDLERDEAGSTMKSLIFFVFTLAFTVLVFSPTYASEAKSGSARFHFSSAKRFKQLGGLPPKLEMIIDLKCNEAFEQLIRSEWVEPATSKTFIAIGALVRVRPLDHCTEKTSEFKVDAGTTFSGREFEVVAIGR